MLELYLLRHAESQANTAPHICSGQSNHVALTDRGVRQAKALNERLVREGIVFDVVYRSSAVRTKQTQEYGLVNCVHQDTKYGILDELLEIHQGDFTGKDKKLVYTPEVLAQIAADPWHFRAPNGESQHDVALRAWEITNNVVESYRRNGSKDMRVAFVTHGLTIKTWMRELMQFDSHLTWLVEIDNASITQFNYHSVRGKSVWVPKRINDAGHIYGI